MQNVNGSAIQDLKKVEMAKFIAMHELHGWQKLTAERPPSSLWASEWRKWQTKSESKSRHAKQRWGVEKEKKLYRWPLQLRAHDEPLKAQCTHITLVLYSSSTALKTFASVKSWKQQYELPRTTKKQPFYCQRRGMHQVHCPRWGLRESRQRITKQTAQTPPQSFQLWFNLIRNGEDGIVVNVLHSKTKKWTKMRQSKSRQLNKSLWNGGLGARL